MAEYKSNYTGEQIDTAIGLANTALQTELEPAFNGSASKNITSQDITNWNNKSEFSGSYNDLTNKPTIPSDTSDLTNGAGFITNAVNDLTNYYKKNETYTQNEIDSKLSSVYKYRGTVATYNDLPSEALIIGDVYNIEQADSTHGIKAGDNVAWNGLTWDVLAGTVDLSGYQTKIDSTHKLDADLVDDTTSTNKMVSASDKTNWNGKEDATNKVTTISNESTDTQYPSAKCLYDNETVIEFFEEGTENSPFIFSGKRKGIYYPKTRRDNFYSRGDNEATQNNSFLKPPIYIILYKTYDEVEVGEYFGYMFYYDSTDGNEYNAPIRKMANTTNVNVETSSKQHTHGGTFLSAGTQTFSGVKYFSYNPLLSRNREVTNNLELVHKKYVDDSIASKENTSNKVTSVDSTSTDTEYPSAKAVYDLIGSISGGGAKVETFINNASTNFPLYNKDPGVYVNTSFDYTTNRFYYDQSSTITGQQTTRRNYLLIIITKNGEEAEANENIGCAIGVNCDETNDPSRAGGLVWDPIVKGELNDRVIFTFVGRNLQFVSPNAQRFVGVKTFASLPQILSYSAPTSNTQFTPKKYVDDIPTTYAGYDATKTQVLKNINGTLTWVDE